MMTTLTDALELSALDFEAFLALREQTLALASHLREPGSYRGTLPCYFDVSPLCSARHQLLISGRRSERFDADPRRQRGQLVGHHSRLAIADEKRCATGRRQSEGAGLERRAMLAIH